LGKAFELDIGRDNDRALFVSAEPTIDGEASSVGDRVQEALRR
jgi:hypothetical protein